MQAEEGSEESAQVQERPRCPRTHLTAEQQPLGRPPAGTQRHSTRRLGPAHKAAAARARARARALRPHPNARPPAITKPAGQNSSDSGRIGYSRVGWPGGRDESERHETRAKYLGSMLRAAWLGAALATAGAADDDQAPPRGNSSLPLPLPRRALQAADERAVLLAFKASGTDPDGVHLGV